MSMKIYQKFASNQPETCKHFNESFIPFFFAFVFLLTPGKVANQMFFSEINNDVVCFRKSLMKLSLGLMFQANYFNRFKSMDLSYF